jgi:lipopolysaccharide export system permease protein
MRRLTLYILRQIVGPFALFTVLLTLVVWLTQSLRLLDLVINRGQSAGTFAYLTLLMLPSLLTVILPVAFFGAALYALHKLNNDSEMVVMWSAGVSRFQLALPVLIAASVAMLLTYLCSLYLMPAGQRAMRDKVFDIRADIGAAILREGAFVVPTNGLTVFIREIRPAGEIRGILVHDNRNPERPMTFLAESGMLAQTPDGARLIMSNGNVQQAQQEGARLSVVRFDRYVFDLDQFAGPQRANEREASERYLDELLWPELEGPAAAVRTSVYRAEAHNRLSAPLYCVVFALIALAATAGGYMARGSYALRLIAAALGGAVLRMVGYGVQGAAARNPYLSFLLYLVPLTGIILVSAVLAQLPLVPAGIKRRILRSVPESA